MLNHKLELVHHKKVNRILPDGRSIVTFLGMRLLDNGVQEKYCVVVLLESGINKGLRFDNQPGVINSMVVHANGHGKIEWHYANLKMLLDRYETEQVGI